MGKNSGNTMADTKAAAVKTTSQFNKLEPVSGEVESDARTLFELSSRLSGAKPISLTQHSTQEPDSQYATHTKHLSTLEAEYKTAKSQKKLSSWKNLVDLENKFVEIENKNNSNQALETLRHTIEVHRAKIAKEQYYLEKTQKNLQQWEKTLNNSLSYIQSLPANTHKKGTFLGDLYTDRQALQKLVVKNNSHAAQPVKLKNDDAIEADLDKLINEAKIDQQVIHSELQKKENASITSTSSTSLEMVSREKQLRQQATNKFNEFKKMTDEFSGPSMQIMDAEAAELETKYDQFFKPKKTKSSCCCLPCLCRCKDDNDEAFKYKRLPSV